MCVGTRQFESIRMQLIKLKTISLKQHPTLNEAWLQNVIAEDPSILGLGELSLRDKERIQPSGGRIDLILQDDANVRYEVEIQLGATDESHIIRTIEYWDGERSRYPQYEHKAVLIAENVTSRFSNVLRLFNGHIPLIVLQMSAIETDGGIALHFTKVIDEIRRGLVDKDESAYEPATFQYWEKRATPETVKIAHDLLKLCKEVDPTLELKPNKHYIGLQRTGAAFNFVYFRPRKVGLLLSICTPRVDEVDKQLEDSGLELLEYNWGEYRIKVNADDVKVNSALLIALFKTAYELRN
jgi:hypothetical protein